MIIGFDGSPLLPEQTGVGCYTEHLLFALLKHASDDLAVFSHRPLFTSRALPDVSRLRVGGNFPVRSLWMQLIAPAVLKKLNPAIAHFTNSVSPLLKVVPSVVTIYDMTLSLFPQFHPRRRLLTRPLINLTARRADAVITVSRSARKDISNLIGIPAERIHVIYGAAAPIFRPVSDPERLNTVRKSYSLGDKFVLTVGTIEPRKNLVRLIKAFSQLREKDSELQLVCVGNYGWGHRRVAELIHQLDLERAVKLTGYVPFSDLPALYSLCDCFVYPSLYEGFGLPVVEAMACGAPVIAATGSSLDEVVGTAAERVDPEVTDTIVHSLDRVITERDFRHSLAARSIDRASQFSWKRAAEQTLEVYRSVVGRGVSGKR